MDCTALQPLEIARFKTWDLRWTYLALGYFSATSACTPFLLEVAPSYPWPTRPDILKPHSCSACNKVSTIVWSSNFSSLTNPVNSSQTSFFSAEISHTHTELFSCRTILRFVGHYTHSNTLVLMLAQTQFLMKLSHKLIISFWILGGVYLALPEAWSKWSLSSGSYLDF